MPSACFFLEFSQRLQHRLPRLNVVVTPVFLALTLLIACFSPRLFAQQPGNGSEVTAVIGAQAILTDWSDPLAALGTLRANESVTLSSTVTDTVEALNFEGSEKVAKGQVLVRLSAQEELADLKVAQTLREERANAVQRLARLQQRDLAPLADLEDSRTQLRQVEAEIQALQARLDDHTLRAPFAGVVGARQISVGTLVTPGSELATLDDVDRLKLDFRIPEVQLGMMAVGLSIVATSSAYPDEVFEGTVSTIDSRVDPISRSVGVRALLDNDERLLRPGMLMRVKVARAPRQTLVIPESALVPQGRRQYVWVVVQVENDEAEGAPVERREVEIGSRREGEVEILEGLEEDDMVVSHGGDRLRQGVRVRLIGVVDENTSVSEILDAQRSEDDT
ncbi:efflux RND transporter periplasmic adaptor subunit [Halomonas sp. PR-M31]|uniref:efflux RND transporter periplasmic adaptor subunit n=1 Tax=Halomonas sp. PR-M31 TaxID=1471202 RepID=UPI0009E37C4A|nr:efflux RND transporter periplasmic adaptor subunit [Halomonas sp. PR-M31]